MPAYLEHGIGMRVGSDRRARLGGDFVAHHVGAYEFADYRAARPSRGRMHHAHAIAQTGFKRRKPLAHGVFRIAARAQVLGIEQFALQIHQHQIRAGRAHIYAQHARRAAVRRHGPWLRLGRKSRAGNVALVGQGRKPRQCFLLNSGLQGGNQVAKVDGHESIESIRTNGLCSMRCSARSLHVHASRICDKIAFIQLEHDAHRPHHARVAHHTARKQHGSFHRHFAHDGGLVAFHHGIAQPQQNILDGHTFLLAMDDVGFGEHGAAPRKPRRGARALDDGGIILDRKAQTPHLVFEKRARARRTTLVHGELRRTTVGDARHEERVLRAHLHDASRARRHHGGAERHGRHIFEHAHARGRLANRFRARARRRDARARAPGQFLGRNRRNQKLPRTRRDASLVRLARAKRHVEACARVVQRDHLHRRRSSIYAHKIWKFP